MPLLPPLPAPVLSSRNAADNLLYHRDLDAGRFRRVIPAAPLKPYWLSPEGDANDFVSAG